MQAAAAGNTAATNANAISLDLPKELVEVAKKTLSVKFAPSEKYAQTYTLLGLIVVRALHDKKTNIVQLAPSTLSKAFKHFGINNAAYRIMNSDSQQFAWMSHILQNIFGLGVVVSNSDTLIFIDLDSDAVKNLDRISVNDIETFNS